MIEWVLIQQEIGSETRAMKVPGGVVLRVTSMLCGTISESICFIPGAGIMKENGRYELYLP